MKLMLAVAFALVLILVNGVNAFQYENSYYIIGGTGTSIDTDPISFYSDNGDTDIALNIRASFNSSSPFSYNLNFNSPYVNTISFGSDSLTGNYSCKNLGNPIESYVSPQVIESRGIMTNDADDATIYQKSTFTVDTTDRYLELFSYRNVDTENYVPNIYFVTTCSATSPTPTPAEIYAQFTGFEDCGNTVSLARFPTAYTPAGCGSGTRKEYGFVIVNSTAGVINYSMAIGSPAAGTSQWIYYPFDTPTSYTDLGTGTSKSGSVTLDSNRLYVFAYGQETGSGISRVASSMNFTVDLGLADYDCPDWDECIDDFQQRTCIDANGLQPDKVEIRSCSIIILENVTFGFENFTTRTDIDVCSPTWFFGCGYTGIDIDVDVPEDWVIVWSHATRQDYFLQMTDEWATDGSRSLKMWVIPPSQGEPNTGGFVCENGTTARYPSVYKPINDTFLLSFNVTFPAENMLLSYDVKSCDGQVLKHGPLNDPFLNFTWCPERCYAESCNSQPKGNYVFNIQDTVDAVSVIGNPFYSVSQPLTTSVSFPLENVVVGRNYNIVFGTIPENVLDRSGQCVMIDNVRYEVIEEAITASLVPDCISTCIGNNYYQTTRLSNNQCSLAIIEDSPNCLDAETALKVSNLEPYCLDSDTAKVYNSKTGKYEDTDCTESRLCYEGACVTEEDAVIVALNLYLPHPVIQNILTEWNLPYNGFGIVWFFNSIFMYINYLAIGLAIGVALVVRGGSHKAKDMYIPFIAVMVTIIVSATLGGYYPLEIGLPIIVFIGILLWKTGEGIIGGHGKN